MLWKLKQYSQFCLFFFKFFCETVDVKSKLLEKSYISQNADLCTSTSD